VASVRWVRMLARLNLAVEWPVSDGSGCWPGWIWLSSGQCQMGPDVGQAESGCQVVSVIWFPMLANVLWQIPSRFFSDPTAKYLLMSWYRHDERRLPFKSRPFHYWDHYIIVQCLKYPGERSHCVVKLSLLFTCPLKKYTTGFSRIC